jgi:hypothetical protein
MGQTYIFRKLATRLVNLLRNYRFKSDYRASLAIIENVYRKHATRINSSAPSRYVWRSICQYQCQGTARQKMISLAANIIAFLGLPLLFFLVRPKRKADTPKVSCKYLKIDFHMAYQVPAIIKGETLEKSISKKYLNFKDLTFAFGTFVRNHAFYPELLFKFALWIASVRPYIDFYSPEYLIQYCEWSATSSLRKLFLNKCGIRLANVTHGEEFINCLYAFSSCDQYFAWEVTPRSLHDAIHIEYTDRFTFNPCAGFKPAPAVATPTLGFLWPALDAADLEALIFQLNNISNYCTVVVRPHPSPKHSNQFQSYRRRLNAQVSDAQGEDIHHFIDRCSLMAGIFSSALVQAALRGREIVYLRNPYLESVREYHTYYQKFDFIEVEQLDRFVSSKLLLNNVCATGESGQSSGLRDDLSLTPYPMQQTKQFDR